MKVRHIKRRTVAAMLGTERINFHVTGRAHAVLMGMSQQQRESFVKEAMRQYAKRGGE